MENIPGFGFRFHPTDEELITHYLSKRSQMATSMPGQLTVEIKVKMECYAMVSVGDAAYQEDEPSPFTIEVGNEGLHVSLADPTDHQDDSRRSGSGSGRGPPSDIGQDSRVQTSIGRGRGRGRFQSMQHRQEDHIPPAPPERGLTLSRPPPPSAIQRPAIRPAPFELPSRPASRPWLIEGTLDLQRDALSPPTEQLISTGLAELASMTRQYKNSTPSLALITLHLPHMQVSKKLGRNCTSLELYLHVHTKKHDGQTFIDARSERVNAEIQRMREEISQSAEEAGDDPHVDETDLYYKFIGVDHKGRVYGLGSTGRRYNDPGASSSQGPSSQDFATLQSNVSRLTSIVEDQQNQIQTQHEQIALLQSMLMQSMRGGHPGASSSHPPPPLPPPPPPPPPRLRLRPPPPPCPSHQETLTPPTAVPTPALDANDVYLLRMYEPEDEEETNLPLQQEWIDALSDTHPLPRPDRDN
ncbi:hypothetical protein Sjap_021465 [Stephania japonica]|uniref:NAC domain-containing protein n=1 Tax=Stephania japonica TaxID=461633 RepID=A0AAP0HP18_9MAGN